LVSILSNLVPCVLKNVFSYSLRSGEHFFSIFVIRIVPYPFQFHSVSILYPFCIRSVPVPFGFLYLFCIRSVPVRKRVSSDQYCSRSNLIGVTYIHLSLTHSLTHSSIDPSITCPDAPTQRYFFCKKKITQKLVTLATQAVETPFQSKEFQGLTDG